MLANSCMDQVLSYLQTDGVSKLWRAKGEILHRMVLCPRAKWFLQHHRMPQHATNPPF